MAPVLATAAEKTFLGDFAKESLGAGPFGKGYRD